MNSFRRLWPGGRLQNPSLISWEATTFWSDSQFLPYTFLVQSPIVWTVIGQLRRNSGLWLVTFGLLRKLCQNLLTHCLSLEHPGPVPLVEGGEGHGEGLSPVQTWFSPEDPCSEVCQERVDDVAGGDEHVALADHHQVLVSDHLHVPGQQSQPQRLGHAVTGAVLN